MARPRKTGLDYFPHDTDASYDEKIEILESIYGNDGYAFVFKMYERIYRNGGELDISSSEMIEFLTKKLCRNSPEMFQKLLETSMNLNIFDKNAYNQFSILTSTGIKKRIRSILDKRQKSIEIYQKKMAAVQRNQVSAAETMHRNAVESTQIKEKESKVKESKEKEIKEKHIKKEIYEEKKEVKKFQKPSLEEVIQYCNEIKSNINAQNFIDANDAKGWVVGKNKTPMRDWRAVIRTWEYNRRQCQNESKNIRNTIYPEL